MNCLQERNVHRCENISNIVVRLKSKYKFFNSYLVPSRGKTHSSGQLYDRQTSSTDLHATDICPPLD